MAYGSVGSAAGLSMGFLDKFNDWYIRAVPDSAPGIDWTEPAAGAVYRRRRNLPKFCLAMLLIGPLGASQIHYGRHSPGPSWVVSFALIGGLFALTVGGAWLIAPDPAPIFLAAKFVSLGSGRNRRNVSLDRADSVRRIQDRGGTALSFRSGAKEVVRIYLDPNRAAEISAFVEKAGFKLS
jgi:hypothetical protein